MIIYDLIGISSIDNKFHIKMHIDESIPEYAPLTISGVKVTELDKEERTIEISSASSEVDVIIDDIVINDNFIIFEPVVDNTEQVDWSKIACGADIIDKAVFADAASIVYYFNVVSRDIGNKCHIPDKYINYFIKYKALEYAIRAKNYTKAASWYKRLLSIKDYNNSICNCYGGNNI